MDWLGNDFGFIRNGSDSLGLNSNPKISSELFNANRLKFNPTESDSIWDSNYNQFEIRFIQNDFSIRIIPTSVLFGLKIRFRLIGARIENLLMIISDWTRMSRICPKSFVDVSEWLGFDGIKFQFKTVVRVVQYKSVEIQSDWIRFNLKLQFQSNRDQIYPDRIFSPNNSDSDLFRLKIRFR